MKTLLDYIKQYPDAFRYTAERRSETTPSATNRMNHNIFAEAVANEDWNIVEELINLPEYQKPLDGVVTCLISYSVLDNVTCIEIYEFWFGG